jgi:ribosomal protein S18 acetylase RimI-like enzyme
MNPKKLIYREELRSSDRDDIRRIVSSSGFFSEEEIELALELVDDRLARGEESDYHYIVAGDGKKLFGFACYGPIPATRSSYDLYWIAIDEVRRGEGVGKKLMAKTEDLISKRGGRRVYAETSARSQYEPTRLFYEALGYSQGAYLEDFYAPGDGKIIYVKTLAGEEGLP